MRLRKEMLGSAAVEVKTPTVAEASGRASLRAGERTSSPFDRQRARTRRLRGGQATNTKPA